MAEGASCQRGGPAGISSGPGGRPLGPQQDGSQPAPGQDPGSVLQGAPQRRRAGLRLQGEEGQVGLPDMIYEIYDFNFK